MRAYVLIQTEPSTEPLARELRRIPGIVAADDVGGAYDAIAIARAGSVRHLVEVVVPEILTLSGVTHALPAPLKDSPWEGRENASRDRSVAA